MCSATTVAACSAARRSSSPTGLSPSITHTSPTSSPLARMGQATRADSSSSGSAGTRTGSFWVRSLCR